MTADPETWAYNRARVALAADDDDACRRGWDRLEADFGWPVAAEAWRRAGQDLDAEAERAMPPEHRHVTMLDELYAAHVLTKAQWLRARRKVTDQ